MLSVSFALYEVLTSNEAIRKMARYSCPVEVREKDGFRTIDSNELVPGDVIKVPEQSVLPCDLILLSGSVIMNEAMLTGESIPVIKAHLPNIASQVFHPKECNKYVLSGGTGVVQTRPAGGAPCTAIVTNTGFLTLKGGLVRDILYPKVFKYNFYNESLKFCAILGSFAVIGLCYTTPVMVE